MAAKPLVLAVDDDEMNLKIVDDVLSDSGYESVLVMDGEAALSALASMPSLKVVLLDWMMPKMDGLQVLEAIRSNPDYHQKVVIMLTALDTREKVIAALKKGADDYVVKPFDDGTLLEKVRHGLLMGRKRR